MTLGQAAIKKWKEKIRCIHCQKDMTRGLRITGTFDGLIEGFLKFSQGKMRQEFSQGEYLQMQVQVQEPRRVSDSTGEELFKPIGMDYAKDDQPMKKAFPGELQRGVCLGLSAVWLKFQGRFENFHDHLLDAGPGGGMRLVKRFQLRHEHAKVENKKEVDSVIDEIIGSMPEFKRRFNRLLHERHESDRSFTTTDEVARFGRFADKEGHYLLAIEGRGGHAMGFINHDGPCAFFDPNLGQIDFPAVGNAVQFLRFYMAKIYPEMNRGWKATRYQHEGDPEDSDQIVIKA